MTTVTTSDARARFGELLGRVARGEIIVITRRGVPIAKLTPGADQVDVKKYRKAVRGILALREEFLKSGPGLTLDEIRASIRQG